MPGGNTATQNLRGNRLFGDKSVFCGENQTDLSRKVYFIRHHFFIYIFSEIYGVSCLLGNKIKFKNTYNKKNNIKWVITIIIWTFILSVVINMMSSGLMPSLSIGPSFLILIMLVFLGIVFDIIGVAVTTASEVSFHSMASKGINGAKEALSLIKHAEKVSNFCNDVVGDISGIISGSAAAIIVTQISTSSAENTLLSLFVTALVSSFTVGGKALGKGVAMRRANSIVYRVALVVYYKNRIFSFKRKEER